MKRYLLLLSFLLTFSSIDAQKNVNKFIDQLKKDDSSVAVSLPGWLLRTGAHMAIDDSHDSDLIEDGYDDIIDGIKGVRILVNKHATGLDMSDLRKAMRIIKEEDGFVDYAQVREEGNTVFVMVREDGPRIKNLLVMAYSEDEEFVVMNMKTDIDMDSLQKANLSFNKNRSSED